MPTARWAVRSGWRSRYAISDAAAHCPLWTDAYVMALLSPDDLAGGSSTDTGSVPCLEGIDAGLPGGIEVGVRREPPGEFQYHHAVGESPERPGACQVPDGPQHGRGSPVLHARGQVFAWQGSVGHQQIQVGV